MALVAKLDGLDLVDGTNYNIEGQPTFNQPNLRIEIQPYLQDDGGSVIEGTDSYDTVEHLIPIQVLGSTIDALHINIQALQRKVLKRNVIFEWQYPNATNTNYADVLFCKCDDPYQSGDWEIYERNLKALVNIYITCKPGWRGSRLTTSALSYTKTPAIIQPSTISGDMVTPCVMTIQGTSAANGSKIGNNLYVGARKDNLINEVNFTTIKDFQGSSSGANRYYNDKFTRLSGVTSANWSSILGESKNINSISQISTNVGYACCDKGTVLKTTNGWLTVTTYSSANTGTNQNLNDIKAFVSGVVFVGGNGGKVLKTTNSGATWSVTTSIHAPKNIKTIHFNSSNVGWVAPYNMIERTVNGGVTWDSNSSALYSAVNDIYFNSNTVGWIGTDAFDNYDTVRRTIDGGASWGFSYGTPYPSVMAVNFPTTKIGFRVAITGVIHRTINSGVDWITSSSGVATSLNGIQALSTARVYAVGDNGVILKTVNSGANWEQKVSNVSVNLNNLSAINSSKIYVAGDGYTVLKSLDYCETWEQPLTSWGLSEGYKGNYTAFMRARTNSTNPTGVQLRASAGWAGGSVVANSAVNLSSTSAQMQWANLGNINIPVVPLSSGITAMPIIELEAKNGSTKAVQVDADVACLLPNDGETFYTSTSATASQSITLDYGNEAVNKGYDNVDWVGTPGIKLRPGTDNNIVLMETRSPSTSTKGISPARVSFSYYPRYLSPVR